MGSEFSAASDERSCQFDPKSDADLTELHTRVQGLKFYRESGSRHNGDSRDLKKERMGIERIEDIEEWQLALGLTRKFNARKVTLNGEP